MTMLKAMTIRSSMIGLVLMCVSVSCAASGSKIAADDIFDEFFYAELVVEGTVERITEEEVYEHELIPSLPPDDDKFTMAVVTFKIQGVLIGDWNEEQITFVSLNRRYVVQTSRFDLEEGDHYILAL